MDKIPDDRWHIFNSSVGISTREEIPHYNFINLAMMFF